MREFLASAWLRMAQLLGPGFLEYLPVILPTLLSTASAKIVFTELEEEIDDDPGQQDSGQFIPTARVNGRNVGINTTLLSEKAGALESLASILASVGAKNVPDAPVIFDVSRQLVNFEWSGDVRCAAVECATAALDGIDDAEIVAGFVTSLLDGLESLFENEFAGAALDSLSTLLAARRLHPVLSALQSRVNQTLASLVQLTCQNILAIQQASEEGAGEELADEAEEEGEEGSGFRDTVDEEEVLYAWGRVQASIFQAFPEALDNHRWALTFASHQITAPKPDNEALKHVSLGVLCDFVEWCGEAGATAFGQELIDSCLASLSLSDSAASPLVRQVSAHLAGQMARYGGPAFRDFLLQAAAPLLAKLVSRASARAHSQLEVTDNAVSALIRIHVAYPGALAQDTSSFIGQFLLPGLPVISDGAEVSPVVAFLLQNFNQHAVWAPAVLAALVTVKTTPSASTHLKPEIADALQVFLRDQLAQSSAKDGILSSLTSEQLNRL
jgi:hypothetical protein